MEGWDDIKVSQSVQKTKGVMEKKKFTAFTMSEEPKWHQVVESREGNSRRSSLAGPS